MTATNHALTGAVIGLVIGQPWIAVPAAIVSHFVCDTLPHAGSQERNDKVIRTKLFRNYLLTDGGLCVALVGVLALFRPEHWFLAAVCAFLATSPDLLWINRYLKARAGRSWKPGAYSKFARDIQWFQRPIGAVVEITWFAAALIILIPFFR